MTQFNDKMDPIPLDPEQNPNQNHEEGMASVKSESDSDSTDDFDWKKGTDEDLESYLMGYRPGKNPQEVEELSTLALKCSMKSLLNVICQNIQEYNRERLAYDKPKEDKNVIIDKIVAYHQSYRELLASTTLIDKYNDLNRKLFATKDDIGIMEFLFWLCYENTDSKHFSICKECDSDDNPSNPFKINFILKSENDFANCTKISLKFDDDCDDELKDIERLFDKGKFPNVKDLTVDFGHPAYNSDFIDSLLPKVLPRLKKLDITFAEYFDICDYIHKIEEMKERNTDFEIEKLRLNLRSFFFIGADELFEDDPEYWQRSNPEKEEEKFMQEIFHSLKAFPCLKEIHLEGWEHYEMKSKDFSITTFENEHRIINVKSAIFESFPISLVKINNYFKNLETLTLINFQFPEHHLEKIQLLPSLITLKHLSIDYKPEVFRHDYKLKKLSMSTWLRLFPNLQELELRNIVQEDSLANEMKSLKVLKIRDKLQKHKILSSFPNLNHFVQDWPKDNFKDELRKVKAHIPQLCRLFKIEEGSEEEII